MFLAFIYLGFVSLLQHNPDNMDQIDLRPVYILQAIKSIHISHLKKKKNLKTLTHLGK